MSRGGTDANTIDPFTEAYDALFRLLLDDPVVGELVKVSNRISYSTKDADPVKDNRQSGDVPELELRPSSIAGPVVRTCNTVEALQTIELRVATNDMRVNRAMYPLRWAIFCALIDAATTIGLDYVISVTAITPSTDSTEDPESNKGTQGWSTVFDVEIRHAHSRSKI